MPLSLMPYQEKGAEWLARRARAGLLDEPGAGKSCQTIRAIDLRRAKRGVIVCPAHLRENWRHEFGKFSHFPRKICKGRSIHDFVAWSRGVFDILLVSYEMATKWAPRFHDLGEPLDFLAFDEFQYLNNLDTQRTRALLGPEGDGRGGAAQWALQAWALTGTLLTNDPAQCYVFLRFVNAMQLGFPAFLRRYFHTRPSAWGFRNKPKIETLPELQALLRNNAIRRTLAEVGYELPPIFLTSVVVDGDTEEIRRLLGAHPGLDAAIVRAVSAGGLSFLDAQHIATMRRLIGEAKVVPYAGMLLDELRAAPDRKVVVVAVHVDVLLTLRDFLAQHRIWCVLIQGGVSETARGEALAAFQGNPNCRVFLINMRAATGLTLTAAAHEDILESDWAPAGNDQAIKRIRRIGQQRPQHARFITLANSLDETINRIVVEKTAAIASVSGDRMLSNPEAVA